MTAVPPSASSTPAARPPTQDIALERTRLLYQGSQTPTLLMLLVGLACTGLLWSPGNSPWLASWLVSLVVIALLRLQQVYAFNRASPPLQAQPRWRQRFLLGAAASGLSLACAVVFFLPVDNPLQQALLFGLIATAILSSCTAYAVSKTAFLAFTLPCMLPSTTFLLLSDNPALRSWGLLCLIFGLGLLVTGLQVNRLLTGNLLRRLHNLALIDNLGQAKLQADQLNSELAREVEQRRHAERELRAAQAELEMRVAQRTLELDETTHALSKSETRLALALEASQLGLWDWDLVSDQVHHSQLRELFGLDSQSVAVLADLKPRLHPDDLPT